MELDNEHIIYTAEDIMAYLNGKLSAPEMYAIEKQALQDAFLADAIEGFYENKTDALTNYTLNIKNTLSEKNIKPEAKIVSLPTQKITSQKWLGAIASIFLVITSTTIFWVNNKGEEQTPTATNELTNKNQKRVYTDTQINIKEPSKIVSNIPYSINEPYSKKTKEVRLVKTDIKPNKTINNVIVAQQTYPEPIKEGNTIVGDVIDATAKTEKTVEINKDESRQVKKVTNNNETEDKTVTPSTNIASLPNNKNLSTGARNNNENISGRIVNQQNEPIGFARVQLNGSAKNTNTNADGYFNISGKEIKDSLLTLNVNATGYQPQQITLNNQNNSNIYKLDNNNEFTKEVVITNTAKQNKLSPYLDISKNKEEKDASLTPEGGWPAFYKYIEKNRNYTTNHTDAANFDAKSTNSLNKTQKVMLTFKVDDAGNITNIKVEKLRNKQLETKAMELLKNGPKWKTSSTKKLHKIGIEL